MSLNTLMSFSDPLLYLFDRILLTTNLETRSLILSTDILLLLSQRSWRSENLHQQRFWHWGLPLYDAAILFPPQLLGTRFCKTSAVRIYGSWEQSQVLDHFEASNYFQSYLTGAMQRRSWEWHKLEMAQGLTHSCIFTSKIKY